MKFTIKQRKELSEIYRRLNYFHDGNVNAGLMYLALPSQAKTLISLGLITSDSREIPRALNWYRLTVKGKLFFQHYITPDKLSEEDNELLFTCKWIKDFDINILNDINFKNLQL